MTIDPRRLAESGAEAGFVLGTVALPSATPALDTTLATVLAGMLVLITGGVYALHAVTFDCFRVTGQRAVTRARQEWK
jgi:hypothetical protein